MSSTSTGSSPHVTHGAQHAFDTLARVLVRPGRTVVAVEDPGYPPLWQALYAAGARVHPVAVDREGMIVDRIPRAARVVCVTPSHQFPLGVAMSLARRHQLLAFARARGAVVIEDDYDGEFRFGGRPLDALQTLDDAGHVVYVGTFSKSVFPALRCGFMVAPAWLLPAVCSARRGVDWHNSALEQHMLASFIAQGELRDTCAACVEAMPRAAARCGAACKHIAQTGSSHCRARPVSMFARAHVGHFRPMTWCRRARDVASSSSLCVAQHGPARTGGLCLRIRPLLGRAD